MSGRRRHRPPSYRLHKARNCAVVTIGGKNHYLGEYGSEESYQRYAQLISAHNSSGRRGAPTNAAAGGQLQVKDLILRYWRFAESHYTRDGRPTDEQAAIRAALRPLRRLYGNSAAAVFGPKSLKLVQQAMVDADWSRKYINDSVGRIKRMFRWAVSEELVPVTVYEALRTVNGLRRGRSGARDMAPIQPVSEQTVEQTLPFLSPVVADMIRFQRLTGCRPGEVCDMRPIDVDRTSGIWEYRPPRHKTSHLGKRRIILIGPRAQEILRPYLLRPSDAYCFSPVQSEKKRNRERRASRRSPLTPSQAGRKPAANRRRPPSDHYTNNSLRRAVHRACDKAFPAPAELSPDEVQQWRKRYRWSPNQLRHSAATEIRRKYGLEAVTTILGNSLDVAEIYAEKNLDLGRRIAKETG